MKKNKLLNLTIPWDRRPRILFLGNGMSRAFGGSSWEDIIREINYTGTDLTEIKKAPFPLQAVIATGDQVDCGTMEIGVKLKKPMGQQMREYMEQLVELPFDSILTTNYSYELEEAVDPDFLKGKGRFRTYSAHTSACGRVESQFLLHSCYHIPGSDHACNIWHIHGEANKPNSMIFGHYYYGNLLFRYQEYLRQRGNAYEENQSRHKELEVRSWLDYFIMADIYVLGCGLDFSEMDLWWLINRKKREKAQTGKLYHFEPYNSVNHIKQNLVRAFGGTQISCDTVIDDTQYTEEEREEKYKEFYRRAILEIQEQMSRITSK